MRHDYASLLKKRCSVKDTGDKICLVCGIRTTTIRTIGNWLKIFRAGNFDLKGEDASGHPATTDTDLIKRMLESLKSVCEAFSLEIPFGLFSYRFI